MEGKDNKHINTFRQSKVKPGESVEAHLEGWIGEMMGSGDKTQHNGQFILTNERVCFYRKGLLGEVFETIPLSKITSVETLSLMGYRVVRLHTSHDELAFKTFEAKSLFDAANERLEELRRRPASEPGTSAAAAESIPSKLKELAELRDAGIVSEHEFATKKAELLSRL